MNNETTYDLERHLAIKQIQLYLHIQQSATYFGDQQECRRAKDIIEQLVTEYGMSALNKAKEEYK